MWMPRLSVWTFVKLCCMESRTICVLDLNSRNSLHHSCHDLRNSALHCCGHWWVLQWEAELLIQVSLGANKPLCAHCGRVCSRWPHRVEQRLQPQQSYQCSNTETTCTRTETERTSLAKAINECCCWCFKSSWIVFFFFFLLFYIILYYIYWRIAKLHSD